MRIKHIYITWSSGWLAASRRGRLFGGRACCARLASASANTYAHVCVHVCAVSVSSRSIFCNDARRTHALARVECVCVRINFNQVKHEKQTRKGNEANCVLRVEVCVHILCIRAHASRTLLRIVRRTRASASAACWLRRLMLLLLLLGQVKFITQPRSCTLICIIPRILHSLGLCAQQPRWGTRTHTTYICARSRCAARNQSAQLGQQRNSMNKKMVYERKCIVAAIRRRGAPVHLLKQSKCALLIHIINAAAAAAARHSNFGRFSAMSADMETAAESI